MTRILNFVEEIVPNYSDVIFKRFFRLSRTTFHTILEQISPYDEFKVLNEGGRKPLSVEKQLLITLWYLGSKDTTLQIADRFGVTEFSVIQSRRRIVRVIYDYLRSKIIAWPDANEIQYIKDQFVMKCGFPNVIGAVDGTHIRIPSPSDNQEKYINRKGFHSIQLQVLRIKLVDILMAVHFCIFLTINLLHLLQYQKHSEFTGCL